MNNLLISKSWIELLYGVDTDVSVNPQFFQDRCPFIADSFRLETPAESEKGDKCPAYMSWELKDKNNLPFEDNIDYSKFFFYTDPTVNADNFARNIDEQQKKDLKLCVQAENILNRYLNREHGEVMKDASYLGFESNSFCYHPAQYKWYFNDKVQNTTKIDFVNAE